MPWLTQLNAYGRFKGHGWAVKGQTFLPSDEKQVIARVYEHEYDARIWAEDKTGDKDMGNYIYEVRYEDLDVIGPQMRIAKEDIRDTVENFYRGKTQ